MYQPSDNNLPSQGFGAENPAVIVRVSFITQMHNAEQVDCAVLRTLQLLAHTVADFSALPDLRVISTSTKSATVVVSAIWPERIAVKITGVATTVPECADATMLIVSAKISTETPPVAHELADALLGSLPVSSVSRVTATVPRLAPLPNISDSTIGAEHLMQPLSFDPGRGVQERKNSKAARAGWNVVR